MPTGPGPWTDVAVFEGDAFRDIQGGSELADSRDESVNPVFTITLPKPITTRGVRMVITDATDTVSIAELQFQ